MSYTHRPCFGLAISFAVGIWLGTSFDFPWAVPVSVLILLSGLILSRWFALMFYLVFVGLGFIHANSAQLLPPDHIAHLQYDERYQPVDVEGIIASDVDVRSTMRGIKTSFELNVERVGPRQRSGKVLVNIFRREDLHYGDRIRLTGKLHKPFPGSTLGHFSYEDHLKRNGIHWILSVRKNAGMSLLEKDQGSAVQAFSLQSRHRFKNILDRYLNDLEAGVVQSLVLGGKYYIPDTVRQIFVETGTAHILAISGMNIGAVTLLIVIALSVLRVPRKIQLGLSIALLAAYAYFTGANPSVVRATVMAVIFLAAFLIEREQESLNSLGLAALAILLIDPLGLFGIGFQLSFMGVFSIIYLYPVIYAGFKSEGKHGFRTMTLQALAMSLAAWIGVAPLIAYYFQIVTPVTVIANLPIIPFVSALMMLGVGLILAGLVSPWLAGAFAACIKITFAAMMITIESFSRVPFSSWPVTTVTVAGMFMYYAVVLAAFYWLNRKILHDPAHDHAHFLS